MMMRRLLMAISWLSANGCAAATPQPDVTITEQAVRGIDGRLAGTWRLASYTPRQPLSLALLVNLDAERVLVQFQNGRMRNASPQLSYERKYRILPPLGETFKVFVTDETGVEYELSARFSSATEISFECTTAPWQGTGVLQRVTD